MFLHLRTITLSTLSNFITTRLGLMKAWAACNSLDWVTCYPLHFTLAYIVYRESRTRQVVYIHVHYGIHGEMNIGIDSRLIDLSLCSQIKKIRIFVAETRTTNINILSPERAAVCRVFPHRPLQQHPVSGQFSWTWRRADREWLSALMKNRGVGDFVKSAL